MDNARPEGRAPARRTIVELATLYLCRQGTRWIVVLDSPEVRGAARLGRAGSDGVDARFELLARARGACPDASFAGMDGSSAGAEFEWRLDVRSSVTERGALGRALRRALEAAPPGHRKRPGVVRGAACRAHAGDTRG